MKSLTPIHRVRRPAVLAGALLLALAGGHRELLAVDFVRGDVNQSGGALDISDSVTIFSYLFLGANAPACLSAADVNDDGQTDLSDGVYGLQFLFNGGSAPPRPYPRCGPDPTPDRLTCLEYRLCGDCIDAAQALVAGWRAEGLDPLEIERRFQTEIAKCAGDDVDTATATFVGAIKVDYFRLARRVLAETMPTDAYLLRVRDRKRKLRLARADRSWMMDYVRGDADGDLVPDVRDRCPGTPDLDPTTNDGCPSQERLPQAPGIRDVKATMDRLGMVFSDDCDGAPLPETPVPIRLGYSTDLRRNVAIAVTPVRNQPAGCPLFYEVQVRMWAGGTGAGLPPVSYAEMLFQDNENTAAPGDDGRLIFRVETGDPGGRGVLYDRGHHYTYRMWRVRAANGFGQVSAWSAPRTDSAPSFGEP